MTDIPAKVYVPLMAGMLGVTLYVASMIIPQNTATAVIAAPKSAVEAEREFYGHAAKLEKCWQKGIEKINNSDMVPSERKVAYVENVAKCKASMPTLSPEAIAFGNQPVK